MKHIPISCISPIPSFFFFHRRTEPLPGPIHLLLLERPLCHSPVLSSPAPTFQPPSVSHCKPTPYCHRWLFPTFLLYFFIQHILTVFFPILQLPPDPPHLLTHPTPYSFLLSLLSFKAVRRTSCIDLVQCLGTVLMFCFHFLKSSKKHRIFMCGRRNSYGRYPKDTDQSLSEYL